MITAEQLMTEMGKIRELVETRHEAGLKPFKEEMDRMGKSLLKTQEQLRNAQRDQLARATFNDVARVPDGPYAGLDSLDLFIVNQLLHGQIAERPSSAARSQHLDHWAENLRTAQAALRPELTGQAAMDSTTAGSGDELVPTDSARRLWADVHLATKIASTIPTIHNMPSNPFQAPVDLSEPNWYPEGENEAVTTTDLTTGRPSITAYTLRCGIPWAYELDELAVIVMLDEVRRVLTRSASKIIDDVALHADTTLTNGINSDGATIAKSTAGKGHWLLGFDGIMHLPLVDATGQGSDHNAAASDAMFGKLLRKLGKYAVPTPHIDPSSGVLTNGIVYVMDIYTFLTCTVDISNFRTLDKYGQHATILSGELARVGGVPVIVSEQMKLADTDGKVTDAGNGTDTGRVLAFAPSQWQVGFVRDLLIEVDRNKAKTQNIMYGSFLVGLQQREPTIANATHTALLYDITSVS